MSYALVGAWMELDVARHKTEFYRMWQVGYSAGLSHGRIFASMGAFDRSGTVERMRRLLLEGAEQREALSDTVDRAPEHFVPFEAGLLKLGEESGGLEENLGLLGRYFETEHKRMLWVKKKMSYPMMNVLAGIVIAPFPVLFFGDAVRYFTTVGVELALGLAFGGALLRIVARRYRNRPKVVLARLCRALAIAVEAGLPMDRVVDLGVKAADDASLTKHVARLPAGSRANQPLADTFAGWSRLTPDMQQVLAVADETGDYTNTLKRLADLYDDGF